MFLNVIIIVLLFLSFTSSSDQCTGASSYEQCGTITCDLSSITLEKTNEACDNWSTSTLHSGTYTGYEGCKDACIAFSSSVKAFQPFSSNFCRCYEVICLQATSF